MKLLQIHRKHIWVVGAGNMGSAILSGMPDEFFTHHQWIIVDHHTPNLEKWRGKGQTIVCNQPSEIASQSIPDYVLLAVKPQDLTNVLSAIAPQFSMETAIISIAAGKTIASIEACLRPKTPVVRTMPNLPALIGEGATVAVANQTVSDEQRTVVDELLRSIGRVYWVENESLLNAVTALSGSGPAYVYYFTECLIAAGIKLGLPHELARNLALDTVKGSAMVPVKTNQDVQDLRVQVTSPKGTTEAALNVLMKNNAFSALIEEALKAASKRAEELSSVG